MSQIIKVRPKVELSAMKWTNETKGEDFFKFFKGINLMSIPYGIDEFNKELKVIRIDCDYYTIEANKNDWFIQCSNGEYGVLTDKEFKERYDIITDNPKPAKNIMQWTKESTQFDLMKFFKVDKITTIQKYGYHCAYRINDLDYRLDIGDWLVDNGKEILVYKGIEEEVKPSLTTINNIAIHTHHDSDDFIRELSAVIKKYGVGK